MTDPRPAPLFGEYASREEQLAHIKSPSPEQLDPSPTKPAAQPAAAPPMADQQALAASRNQFNMVGTIAFLIYGLVEVVLNTPSFLNFALMINDQLAVLAESLGIQIDAFPASNTVTYAGYALAAAWVLIWLGAALWSWSRLRRKKLSMWVPFLAGVSANLIAGIVMTALIFSNSTIANQLVAAVTGGAQ